MSSDIDTIAPLLDCTPKHEFAHYTATQRWPQTINNVIRDNKLSAESHTLLQQLISACAADTTITLSQLYEPSPKCAEHSYWLSIRNKYIDRTLLTTPWYVAESYLYHMILTATRYFDTHIDPFQAQNQAELDNSSTWQLIDSAVMLCTELTDTTQVLSYLLELCVYGNRIDLSYHTLSNDKSNKIDSSINGLVHALDNEKHNVIVNDSNSVLEYINNIAPLDIHIIHDNSGTELLCDLVLIYYLLCTGTVNSVTMHVKQYPTFVSDATKPDVLHHIITMIKHRNDNIKQCGNVLNKFLKSNVLTIQPHTFWNSAEFFSSIPSDLSSTLSESDLTLLKGDANYRRVVDDRLWPTDISLYDKRLKSAQALQCSFVLLRTLKSDTIVGVRADIAQKLDHEDKKWRVNGKRGVIQFYNKEHSSNNT